VPPSPVLPDYGGACISSLVPAILRRDRLEAPAWMPPAIAGASQVVLLVLDGVGWEQLRDRPDVAPTLTSMAGGPITSVAPTTTATALVSLTTGTPPSEHGIVGYRLRVGAGIGEVLNVLRWRTPAGDARTTVDPLAFSAGVAFDGLDVPYLSRSEFARTGFTAALTRGGRFVGYSTVSGLVYETAQLLSAGEPFVYADYDGVDRVAHEHGLGGHYEAELRFADRLVADLLDALPPGAALAVTADHGHVDTGDALGPLSDAVLADTDLVSGEARFRWLHARPGTADRLLGVARAAYGDLAWVVTRDEVVGQGWFGGSLRPEVEARLGDVAVVAHAPVAFIDPRDDGDSRLRSRHGSLTSAEVFVPLVAERR
jgi:hypothetical protein